MSAISQRIQDLAILAITKIAEIAASSQGKDAAFALSIIEKIVAAVRAGIADKMTPEQLAELIDRESKVLSDQLASNDQTILDEIEAKFPK